MPCRVSRLQGQRLVGFVGGGFGEVEGSGLGLGGSGSGQELSSLDEVVVGLAAGPGFGSELREGPFWEAVDDVEDGEGED